MTNCTSCTLNNFLRDDNSCKNFCLMGWFPDLFARKCIACPKECFLCSSLTSCLACKTGFYMRDDSLCYSSCPERQFPNSDTVKCELCPYDCLTCDKVKKCLSCNLVNDHRIFNISRSRCFPADGYFDSGATVSNRCPSECATCTAANLCLTCSQGYYLRADMFCYSQCLPRFYPDLPTLTCEGCPYDCLTCLANGSCLTCDSSSDHRVIDNATSRCIALSGYYDGNATVSLNCPSVCSVCSSQYRCSACNPGSFLRTDYFCHSNCTDRLYPDPLTLICKACPYDCLTCDHLGVCFSCDSSSDHRILNGVTGRCEPEDGYYDNLTSVSLRCPAVCSICQSLSICSFCA